MYTVSLVSWMIQCGEQHSHVYRQLGVRMIQCGVYRQLGVMDDSVW